METVTVVGAGLAGCEAAWQLAQRQCPVRLIEMKPHKYSPAHKDPGFGELVCSNSLKAEHLTNASGLLKAEMDKLGSLVLSCARAARVPAGGALAVDRAAFSRNLTEKIEGHPLIRIERRVVTQMPDAPAIISTGPLTDDALAESIAQLPNCAQLHFFDAAAPIVTRESLDMDKVFRASRYGNGDDYLNCPMDERTYSAFYNALIGAQMSEPHGFEKRLVFEGCLAVEILAARGRQTLAYGPLKPIGLTDPHTGRMPYAVVQLRQDNAEGTLYNLVGFQTRLKWGEQKRVFSMIPGLEHAEFVRYGVMHRNTYLNSPDVLGRNYALKDNPLIRFAGQLTGVEGYVESAASGLLAGLSLARHLRGDAEPDFGNQTIMGALETHVRTRTGSFQPMNANFGVLAQLDKRIREKQLRYEALSARALHAMDDVVNRMDDAFIEPADTQRRADDDANRMEE
ncbi:MAG: methylenetetrahydrofolate--tRNA-(uracil(54)-C(5))-methyltransferase (FADH(2)-oxidizing) TrmFO [Clostridia bacterium]